MKPYSKEYYDNQLINFNNKIKSFKVNSDGHYRTSEGIDTIDMGNISIKYKDDISGRIDGYMYKNFTTLKNIPVLLEKDDVWMSVTPMEIDSHWLPIRLASGRVGVAGLGLGYYIQNILDKDNVDEVIVYEINDDVINLYRKNFGEHPKLTILKENVRELKNEEFDFFYCDIYPNLVDDKAVEDMKLIKDNNNIDLYYFWTMEYFFINAVQDNNFEIYSKYLSTIPFSLFNGFMDWLNYFMESDYYNLYDNQSYISDDEMELFFEAI